MGLVKKLRKLWRSEFLSPKDFLVRAAAIGLLFLIAHLAGLREFTSVLNGTVGSVEMGWGKSAFFGAAYILIYLGFVLVVPILVIAAAITAVLQKLFRSNPPINEPGTNPQETN